MLRRMAIGGATAAMALVLLAGCGGSSATPSASAEASVPATEETPAGTEGIATDQPPTAPDATATAASQTKVAACAGVGVRKSPGTGGAVLVRLGRGAVVRAVETVTGDAYQASSCGTAGADWLKIDRVNGKSVKSLYGVTYAYAAAGFFR